VRGLAQIEHQGRHRRTTQAPGAPAAGSLVGRVTPWYLALALASVLPPTTTSTPDPAVVREIKALIVESLMLEGVTADEIATDAPLFGEGGLGLDSIDVLELAMALHKRFGVKTKGDDARNREIFASVGSLAAFVIAERAVASPASETR